MKWKSWHADGVTSKQIPNVLSACCFSGFEEIIALEVYVLEETRHFYGSISWLCFLLINALVFPTEQLLTFHLLDSGTLHYYISLGQKENHSVLILMHARNAWV